MAKYTIKFMFDWGSGVCLWSTNKAAKEKFENYPILTSKLQISKELKNELDYLTALHDEALNWDNPSGDLLWDDQKVNDFLEYAKRVYHQLVIELGSDYQIEFIESL